jgi:hypothetical protein
MKSFYEFYLQIQRENAAAPAAPGAAPAAAPAAGAAPAPAGAGTVAPQAKLPSPSEVKAVTDLKTATDKINISGITDPEKRNQIDALKKQIAGLVTSTQQAAQAAPKPGAPAAPAKPGAPVAPAAPAKPGAPVAPAVAPK